MFNVMIKGHTLEFRESSTGSIDPWTQDYYQKKKISAIGTSDMCDFVMVDREYIYCLEYESISGFIRDYSDEKHKTWEDVQEWLRTKCKLIKRASEIPQD